MNAYCFITHEGEMKLITIHDQEMGCKLQSLLCLTEMPPSGSMNDDEINHMFAERLGLAGYVAPVKIARVMQ